MKFINPFNQLSGIYRILNRVNGNCYIGSSLNIEKRYKHHLSTLRHNSSRCSILQKAFNKYGEDNFEFQVLLCCKPEYRLYYEDVTYLQLIEEEFSQKNLEVKIRNSRQNLVFNKETIEKMSNAKKGKPWSEKRRAAYLKKKYNE